MKSLISIGVIGVCVAAYFVYIKPLSVEVKVLSAQKDEYTNVLNTVQEIKEKRDAVLLDYNNLSPEDISKLSKIIPEKLNTVVYLNDLSSLAAKHGIQIKDYKVTEESRGSVNTPDNNVIVNSFKATKLSLKLSGSYPAFLNFLNEMESALSLTDVISLRIDKGSNVLGPALFLDYTLEAKVYSF